MKLYCDSTFKKNNVSQQMKVVKYPFYSVDVHTTAEVELYEMSASLKTS
jgi:hypothetical protein